MNYDVIALACEQLDYRDKLRLAQLLIQTARKEEETVNPQDRTIKPKPAVPEAIVEEQEIDTISYVYERLLKLRPVKTKSLTNSIKAMFQFQGGISEAEVSDIVSELQHRKLVKLSNNKVEYND
ncbi:hypothetical protein ABNJ92_004583 [Vibrio parahaemolyticus]|uniref:hypothetical protein n=1 Tax=Vibrio parahaemolyticus TaxID=670 RepID=UPI00186A25F3|nr:hypothetical protein [Vibrio parahaemolyticus]MBE3802972.1 hypothetical protein [Vibrio parahaemolyticus]MBE3830438.1 hypothetical protein [Vibrio parahaemolyticus]MBE3919702.1 hypothetical protein [Vibrio parahaemolyticus]MBE3985964.1 hypothetical protein [Vibrio parahaemolyticus]MBE4191647.1 hypothetical protein [Vibrio parahaemolyticus]